MTDQQRDEEKLREEIRGHVRFAAITWIMAIPLMYAILLWMKMAGEFGNWLLIALYPPVVVAPMFGGLWLAARSDIARSHKREADLRKE
jgi:hypothetical protein